MGKEESGLRKILIVEDDKVLNKTLAYNLTADGYEVTSAYSFQDAVERLKKSEFDIALLDINLPDGNGLHLCDILSIREFRCRRFWYLTVPRW